MRTDHLLIWFYGMCSDYRIVDDDYGSSVSWNVALMQLQDDNANKDLEG